MLRNILFNLMILNSHQQDWCERAGNTKTPSDGKNCNHHLIVWPHFAVAKRCVKSPDYHSSISFCHLNEDTRLFLWRKMRAKVSIYSKPEKFYFLQKCANQSKNIRCAMCFVTMNKWFLFIFGRFCWIFNWRREKIATRILRCRRH